MRQAGLEAALERGAARPSPSGIEGPWQPECETRDRKDGRRREAAGRPYLYLENMNIGE